MDSNVAVLVCLVLVCFGLTLPHQVCLEGKGCRCTHLAYVGTRVFINIIVECAEALTGAASDMWQSLGRLH